VYTQAKKLPKTILAVAQRKREYNKGYELAFE
jgi:hypothetical protein